MTKFVGTELDMQNVKITNLDTCTVPLDAANKAYVDSVAGGTYVAGDGLTDSPANTFNVANTDGNLVVGANSVDFSAGAAAVIAAGPATTYTAGDGLTDSPAGTFNAANTDGYLAISANSIDLSAGAAAVIAAGPATTYTAGAGLTDSPAGTFNVVNTDGFITVTANSVDLSAGAAAVIAAGPASALAAVAPPLVNSGGASSTGVATTAARGDHTHGLTLASLAPPLVASDSVSVVGVATTPARSDHTHGLTMASVAPPVINTSGTSTLGVSALPARQDHTHGIALATTSVQGAMSATDKATLTNYFNNGFYNVVDWGVTTAGTAAANLTAMNTLLTAATAQSTIYFPPSATGYQFSGVITVPAKAFRFLGGGQTKTLIQTTSGTANMFTVGASNTEFVGLRFGTTVTRTAGATISTGAFSNIKVADCYLDAQFTGIAYSGGVDCTVVDCYFNEIDATAIEIQGASSSLRVSNCVGNCTSGVTAKYIHLIECASFIMSDCRWKNAVVSLALDPNSGTKAVRNVAVTNTNFESATGESVKTTAGAAGVTITGVMFDNCRFNSNAKGVEIGGATATVKHTGFHFTNCDFLANSRGIHAIAVQEFSISNCLFAGNTAHGIQVAASTGDVTKFYITNSTIGPGGGSGANAVGITIDSGSYGAYTIMGNNIAGNTSNNGIVDLGTVPTTDLKKVINNAGHLIQGTVATNRGAVTSSTSETLLMNARIPPKAVLAGQVLRFTVWGQTSDIGTLIFRVRAGAAGTVAGDTTVISLQATTAAQVTNAWQCFTGLVRVVTAGSSGTIAAQGEVLANGLVTSQAAAAETLATVNVDNAWFIDLTCACAVAGTFTVRNGVVEVL